jgi:Tol biopolymer transport system component
LERFPVWSGDGRSIFLASSRTNVFDIYRRPWSGEGDEDLVFSSEHAKQPLDVSPDGQFMLFEELNPDTGRDLWLLSLADRTAHPLVKTPYDDRMGAFSPDGRWIAYTTNESGRYEVWARSRSEPGARVRISEQGGTNPQWRRDGRELFYGDLEDRVVAVSIAGGPGGGVLEPGTPTVLFAMQPNRERIGGTAQPFAVSPDGQRFLVNTRTEEAATPPISLVLNWRSPQRP